MRHERTIGGTIANICIYTFLSLFALSIIFPFYNMVILSLSTFADAATTRFVPLPANLTFENYERIFADPQILTSFWISFQNVVFGTSMALVITVFTAYALSRRNLPGRKFMFYFMVITMFFSAGLVPWYLVMVNLGFVNNFWVMTVPGILSTFNVILVRNYFMSLPESIEESARIDGAGEFIIMWRIIVPLSMPIMATVALFYAVGFWNSWFNAMIFIQDRSMIPIALVLRRLVIENSMTINDPMGLAVAAQLVHSRALELATVTVATIPILLVYPFLQRYFTKGIILGAVKA
ncbi:MAG: carbohydrate ABC transporter permease [Oscillospiraceae bacterium]|nr:carbohydrate ABC transporter permease [Oscillospiraceae bacterium]MCL2278535.1 carbohydrate ABC transporter permease [Oscillospiraceae bacterium]